MPLDDARDLLGALGAHAILPKASLDQARVLQGRFPKAADLARELVHRGLLTKHQANEIIQGRAAGLVLGPYLLLEPLRKGGMGEVFKGRHRDLDRLVALKLIRVEYADRADTVERFRRECLAAARLSHPNIVLVYDAHLDRDPRYLAMEYLDGMDLGRFAKERGPLPPAEACEYARQAALGLQHAHERGLVHRDVKPANLMRTADGATVKLLDLGLARLRGAAGSPAVDAGLTQQGVVMGTPDYLAPEQAGGDSAEADARTDVYSLGCTLFHLLSGRPPFAGRTVSEKIVAHLSQIASLVSEARPGLPVGLPAVVRRMMAKHPAERYQTAAEVAAVLEPFCRKGPGAATASLPPVEPTPIGGTLPQIPTPAVRLHAAPVVRPPSPEMPAGSTLPQTPSAQRPPQTPLRRGRRWMGAAAAVVVLLTCPCLGVLGWWMLPPPARNGHGAPPAAQANDPPPADKDKGPVQDPGPKRPVAPRIDLPPPPKHVAVRDGLTWPPAECVALLGDDSGRHWGDVQTVACRPDGQVIATADQVGGQAFIHLWDAATLRERAAWTPAGVFVMETAFSPDGKRLAAVCGDGLRLWDAADDGLSRERKFGAPGPGSGANLFHLVFTTDGQSLLAWDAAGAVRKWRLTAGDPAEDGDPVPVPPRFLALTVSADGKTEAYSRDDPGTGKHQVCVRELSDKPGDERFVELSAAAGALALSADGKRLAARLGGVVGASSVRVWDLDGKEIRPRKTLELSPTEGNDFVPCFTFTPDGERIALAANPRGGAPALHVFDATTGAEPRLSGLDAAVNSLSFSADGQTLAAVGRDHRLRLWDERGGVLVARTCGPAAVGVVRRLAFRPNGNDLAAVSRLDERPEGTTDQSNLIIWDLKKGDARQTMGCSGWFIDCAYTPDGARLFAAGTEPSKTSYRAGFLRLWQAGDLKEEEAPKLPAKFRGTSLEALTFDRDGKTLAMLGGDDFNRKALVCAVDPFRVRGEPFDVGRQVESLALAPDGATAAVLGTHGQGFGEAPVVKWWDVKNIDSGPAKEIEPANPLEGAQSQKARRLTFAPDGKTLAALVQMGPFPDDPRRVLLWDVATGRTRAVGDAQDKRPAHVEALAFAPDGRTLATADADGRVVLWRLETLEELGEWSFPGPVHSVAFDATGGFLATGNADGTIAVLRLPAPAPPPAPGK